MKLGVWIPNCRHLATPQIIKTAAVRAEAVCEWMQYSQPFVALTAR